MAADAGGMGSEKGRDNPLADALQILEAQPAIDRGARTFQPFRPVWSGVVIVTE
jgi:hypothetical protein